MRKYTLQIAGVILNLALNISLAKGWADRVPNGWVIGLYVLSLLPAAYWISTHEKTLRRREWLKIRFRTHTWSSVGACIALGFVTISTVVVVAPRLWRLRVHPSPGITSTTQQQSHSNTQATTMEAQLQQSAASPQAAETRTSQSSTKSAAKGGKKTYKKPNIPSAAPGPSTAVPPISQGQAAPGPVEEQEPTGGGRFGIVVGGSVVDSSICENNVPTSGITPLKVGKDVTQSDLSIQFQGQSKEVDDPCVKLQKQWERWPFDDSHPQMADLFTSRLSEFSSLSGTDRFFIYQLVKRHGSAPTDTFLDELSDEYRKDFGNMRGAPEMVSMRRLEDSGFLEKGWRKREIRLAEPYFSKYSNMEIP